MKLLYSILCMVFFSYALSYGYEPVPEDAKEKVEDFSKRIIAEQAPEAKSRIGKNTIANLAGSYSEEINVVLVDLSLIHI